MPPGPKPKPPGTAKNHARVHDWRFGDGQGWRFGNPYADPDDADLEPLTKAGLVAVGAELGLDLSAKASKASLRSAIVEARRALDRYPTPPDGLKADAVRTWYLWFGSWWAEFWTVEDLPVLELMIELYDKIRRGDSPLVPKLAPLLDKMGITAKGRQDLRWAAPVTEPDAGPLEGQRDELADRRAEREREVS